MRREDTTCLGGATRTLSRWHNKPEDIIMMLGRGSMSDKVSHIPRGMYIAATHDLEVGRRTGVEEGEYGESVLGQPSCPGESSLF